MPRYIVKVGDLYGEWSSVVDDYVTRLMTLDEFRAHYREIHGSEGMRDLPQRMARVEKTGTSCVFGATLNEMLSLNRCGPREGCIPVAKVIAQWKAESAKEPRP